MSRRRRLSPQQRQENISRKQFEEFLEQHEWVTGDISPDLGEDIIVRIYEGEISTGLSFYVQLKSTEDINKHILKSGGISYSFEVKDLEHWDAQIVTVVLCVWDIKRRQGWWIWINHAIQYLSEHNPAWRQKKEVKVHIPIDNEFNEKGLQKLRHLLANHYYPIASQGRELTIQTKFEFPPTPKGKEKFAELERHFAAGDEVEIDGEFIAAFELPEWWTRMFGEIDPKTMRLKLGPSIATPPRPVQMEFETAGLSGETIPYVELSIVKQGREEITLSNEHQKIPFQIKIIINKTGQHNFKFKAFFVDLTYTQLLQILNIQKILNKGGDVRLILLDTNEVLPFTIPKESFPPPDEYTINFVEMVCFIQSEIGTIFTFTQDGAFTRKDVQAAEELISVIKNGNYQQSGMVFSFDLTKQGLEKIINGFKEGSPINLQLISNDSYVELLSQQIELGPMVQKMRGALEMPLAEILAWLEKAEEDDALKIRLINVEMFEEFENWPKR